MSTVVATVAAAVSLFAGGPPPTAHEFPRAERATGHTVICVPRSVGLPADGAYFPAADALGLDIVLCRALWHPRLTERRGPGFVAYAIWALGHEDTHAEQYAAGRPFDEHEADCGGVAKFARLRNALGIRLPLRAPKISGC